METRNGRKNQFSSGLPTRPNATIRSPVAASTEHGRQAANTAYQAHNALIFRLFCSLRLSVRTPPFHGGESGSIPLGSASYFNGLASSRSPLSNGCPISTPGRVWIPICAGSGSAPSFLVFDASLSPTSRLRRSTRQTIPISGAVTLGAPLVRPALGRLSCAGRSAPTHGRVCDAHEND